MARTTDIRIDTHKIQFAREIKFLGVIIDDKLLFNRHIQYTIKKATRIFNRLSTFCRPTWGTHSENVRTIYLQVIQPIVTYAAGVWGHVVLKKCVRKQLLSLQRGFAIRAIRGFRTVSTPAALALARFMPLDLKVREVHALEQIRLTGITSFLPSDILLEKPTPIRGLLHPALRQAPSHLSFSTHADIQKHIAQCGDTTLIYTDGSKLEDSSVGAAFVCYDDDRVVGGQRLKLHDSCSVFQAELLAIHRACLWARSSHTRSLILSDSKAALMAIQDRSNTHPLVTTIHAVVGQATAGVPA